MPPKRPVPREGFGIIKSSSPTKQVGGLLVLIGFIVLLVWYVNRGTAPHAPAQLGSGSAPMELGDIGIEGVGGDPQLNSAKNRYTKPQSVSDLTVNDIIAIPSTLLDHEGRRRRSSWSANARAYLAQQESRGVRVTGYLIAVKQSGPESCNGYQDSLRDYHLWLSPDPTNPKAGAMIVEVTPRWKVVHPEWRLRFLERLAEQHAQVRVTGWLMWDEEHASEVEKSRATQWEVHPITDFEVLNAGAWQPLAVR